MIEELIARKQVQEMFLLTTKQFGRIMRNIEKRHPLESWIKRIKENNKEKVYLKQECDKYNFTFIDTSNNFEYVINNISL